MSQIKIIFCGLILTTFSMSGFGQLLKTTQTINITAGIGKLNGNNDNLFFPSDASQSLNNFGISYERNVMEWLSVGAVLDYTSLSEPNSPALFAQLITNGESILSTGPLASIHTPFKVTGIFTWLRVGLGIAPKYYYYSGDRKLIIDNEVIPINEASIRTPQLEMKSAISGFCVQLRPQLYYRITQRFGLSMAYSINMLKLHTGFKNEPLRTGYFSAGMLVTFGREKQIFN